VTLNTTTLPEVIGHVEWDDECYSWRPSGFRMITKMHMKLTVVAKNAVSGTESLLTRRLLRCSSRVTAFQASALQEGVTYSPRPRGTILPLSSNIAGRETCFVFPEFVIMAHLITRTIQRKFENDCAEYAD
jgi:hypothetical protein